MGKELKLITNLALPNPILLEWTQKEKNSNFILSILMVMPYQRKRTTWMKKFGYSKIFIL